jgi:hypothetical protein
MKKRQTGWLVFMILLGPVWAGSPRLAVTPQELSGIPGQPLRAELTIETDSADPVQLKIPAISNLVLRAVEKIPIQRTKAGTFVQKRIIIWQGVEAGSITVTNLTAVFQGLERFFPNLGITVDAVEPAKPPEPKQETEP